MDWDAVSFVMSSKFRFRILVELKEGEKTPSNLKEIIGVPISHISKTLKELEEKDLITCLTPERRKMKLYTITDDGKAILEKINRMTSES